MSTGATPRAGASSTLKIVVPLVALAGVVFGVTLLNQYNQPDPAESEKGTTRDPAAKSEPPLRFFTQRRGWDPPIPGAPGYRGLGLIAPSAAAPPQPETGDPFGFRLQDRAFQGFFEPGETLRRTQFWFENRNKGTVALQLKHLSCTACTGGRLAAIPPETTRSLFQHSALSALPVGPFNALGVGLVQPAAALTQLEWAQASFGDAPNATFRVPGSTDDKWAPQWGILELMFKVRPNPKVPLEAGFATQVEGTAQSGANTFFLFFEVSPACELSRPSIEVGELDPLSGDREFEFVVFSNTRGPGSEFGDLEPPVASVQSAGGPDPSKFFEVTKVVRFDEGQLADMTERLFRELKKPVNVRAAYRVTLTVRPKVGDARMDVGFVERNVVLTSGSATQSLRVTATVRGPVWLDDNRTGVSVGTISGSQGVSKEFTLNTVKGAELILLGKESAPNNFGYELRKLPDVGSEGRYALKVTIPQGVFGTIKGEAVLEVKGPVPQKMRIPVSGTARF